VEWVNANVEAQQTSRRVNGLGLLFGRTFF
jgi:hypothetical protein